MGINNTAAKGAKGRKREWRRLGRRDNKQLRDQAVMDHQQDRIDDDHETAAMISKTHTPAGIYGDIVRQLGFDPLPA